MVRSISGVARGTKDPIAVLRDAYSNEPFIELKTTAEAVRVADVARTPRCVIGASSDGNRVVVVSDGGDE